LGARKHCPEHFEKLPLDHWIRKRIRMCYWKQWRYARSKVRHLLALATSKRQAIMTAISRKSYWHLSKPRVAFGPRSVDQGPRLFLSVVVCSTVVNRPVWTRMPGGVGAGG
jgi:hypothetical protein